MIKKLKHHGFEVASKIRHVFQASYAIEAQILKAREFPPLNRTLDGFLTSENEFYGFLVDECLVAVIEIDADTKRTHIQSLVVDPEFFRQGIAQKLIDFIFGWYDSQLFTVETGAANKPACSLYKKNGFRETTMYDTDYGIKKVRFEKK